MRTYLQTGIANHTPGHIVDDGKSRFVVVCGKVFRSHGETDRVCETLTEGTGCDLNAVVLDLGMPRTDGIGALGMV